MSTTENHQQIPVYYMDSNSVVTFFGYIDTPKDAMLLFEACMLGKLKKVERRLTDSERCLFIKSGCVFIWDEFDAGIRR